VNDWKKNKTSDELLAIKWLENRPTTILDASYEGVIPENYQDEDGDWWGYGCPQRQLFSLKEDDEYGHLNETTGKYERCWNCRSTGEFIVVGEA